MSDEWKPVCGTFSAPTHIYKPSFLNSCSCHVTFISQNVDASRGSETCKTAEQLFHLSSNHAPGRRCISKILYGHLVVLARTLNAGLVVHDTARTASGRLRGTKNVLQRTSADTSTVSTVLHVMTWNFEQKYIVIIPPRVFEIFAVNRFALDLAVLAFPCFYTSPRASLESSFLWNENVPPSSNKLNRSAHEWEVHGFV